MYFSELYYLEKLNDFINLDLNINDIQLNNNFFYYYKKNPLHFIILKEMEENIRIAFNSLPSNIRFLLNYYVIENDNLLNLCIQYQINLLDLSLYIEYSLDLLKYHFLDLYS